MHLCSQKSLLTVFLLSSLINFSFGAQSVPFLLWSNPGASKCEYQSTGIAGQSVSRVLNDKYMEECLSAINPDKVVIFAFDKLSIEDFTLHGKAFNYIQKNFKKAITSLYQPVEPANIGEDVALKMRQYFPETEIDEVWMPQVDRSSNENTFYELESRDREIEEKLDGLTGSYIVIVTSEGNVKKYGDAPKGSQRHLLQTAPDNANATHIKGECIYMFFTQLNFVQLSKQYALSLDENAAAIETCSNTTGLHTLNLTFTSSPSDIKDVTVLFVFLNKLYPVSGRRWWSLDEVSINYMQNNNEQKTYEFNPRYFNETVSAPDEWSYVCAEPANLTYIAKNKMGNVIDSAELEFRNWQLQPFNVTGGAFSRATDCSGWYTGPIWTGLLVSLLLISILSYGIVMLGYVTTMDRFDDPKKKTITVPQDN